MIKVIQRLLQLAVIGLLVAVTWKPNLAPVPVQGIAMTIHRIVMGPEDNWVSFRDTWQKRLSFLGAKMPDSPPQITADNVLELLNKLTITEPLNKWQKIKPELTLAPIEFESSQAASEAGKE